MAGKFRQKVVSSTGMFPAAALVWVSVVSGETTDRGLPHVRFTLPFVVISAEGRCYFISSVNTLSVCGLIAFKYTSICFQLSLKSSCRVAMGCTNILRDVFSLCDGLFVVDSLIGWLARSSLK